MALLNPSMEDLPVPVIVEILSGLLVKTIIHCKCVCKKWLNLVLDSYFAEVHLSRSHANIMIYHSTDTGNVMTFKPGILKCVEIEDEVDHYHLHRRPLMSLDLNLTPILQNSRMLPVGSVNGLICLWQFSPERDNTCISNPNTREYMILPRQQYYSPGNAIIVHCFGVSSLTMEYKVIRIFQEIPEDFTSTSRPHLIEAEVYTLGTGQWRSLGHVPYCLIGINGPFLNGHAHWIVDDKDSPETLCAFDFNKESFELFPSPPSEAVTDERISECLGVIKGCLCRCDTYFSKFTVWVMKEYGIKNSWHKEVVMEQSISYDLDLKFLKPLYIIQGLKDGTILMASYELECTVWLLSSEEYNCRPTNS